MSEHGPQWDRAEEYRQSVIRKALLLGFSCEETTVAGKEGRHWYHFYFENQPRYGYNTIYGAAYDYLRLLGVPNETIGDYRG